MSLMRQRGTSLDIPTNEDYDCTVLFLWNQKLNLDKPTGEAADVNADELQLEGN